MVLSDFLRKLGTLFCLLLLLVFEGVLGHLCTVVFHGLALFTGSLSLTRTCSLWLIRAFRTFSIAIYL